MTRREKQCRRNLSTSLLDATVPSNEIGSNSDCENRTGTEKKWNHGIGQLVQQFKLSSAGTGR